MSPSVIAIGVFFGVALPVMLLLSLVSAGYWRVGRRLKTLSQEAPGAVQDPTAAERSDHLQVMAAKLGRAGQYSILERELKRAGLHWRPGEYLAVWAAGALVLAGVGWWLHGWLAAGAGAALAGAGGWLTLTIRQRQRMRQFDEQLADALMLIASSLRSGYGILRSIQAIRDEMKPPISTEFGIVLDEAAVGLGVPEALVNLAQRVPLPDLDIAVTAILIHLDVGGNLAEVIETVAATVRERQRIRTEVDVLTAEGRLSGIILFCLPIVMGFVVSMLNPAYMSALFQTPVGHILLICAAVLQVIGGLVIMRMLEVDF